MKKIILKESDLVIDSNLIVKGISLKNKDGSTFNLLSRELYKIYDIPFDIIKKYCCSFYIYIQDILTYQKFNEKELEWFLNNNKEQHINLYEIIILHQCLSEKFILNHLEKINIRSIIRNQVLSDSFIVKNKHLFKGHEQILLKYQKMAPSTLKKLDLIGKGYFHNQVLSKELIKKDCLFDNPIVLNSVYHCGEFGRSIYITKNEPNIINIGCGEFTLDEAIRAINNKYSADYLIKYKQDYIDKIYECFNENFIDRFIRKCREKTIHLVYIYLLRKN